MSQFIGIDLGGTNLRGGLWDGSEKVLHRIEQESLSKRPPLELTRDMVGMIRELQGRAFGDVGGIGVGVPGIVGIKEGVVYESPHFPQWKGFPVLRELRKIFELPLFIDNDANCAALGEMICGAGRGKENLIALTLGTGIGGGIIIDGDVYRGERGFAAELGHIVVRPDGAACHCGGKGCFELYGSATGLRHIAEEMSEDPSGSIITPEALADAAARGEEWALAAFRRFGYYLGLGIASIVNVLGIYTIIIGGRVSRSLNFFIESLKGEFARRSYQETVRLTEIKPAELGDDAGIIGAAYGASRLALRAS